MGYFNRMNLDIINKIYVSPKDLINGWYNLFYKREVERLNKEFDNKNGERKFLIDEDGDIYLNPLTLEKILQKNIDVLSNLDLYKKKPSEIINDFEKSVNKYQELNLDFSLAEGSQLIDAKLKKIKQIKDSLSDLG